jgi:hypothetical protein
MRGARQFQFIAVPVFAGGACIACLGVGFYARAPVAARVASDLYVPTRQAADMIERDIARLQARAGAIGMAAATSEIRA